MTALDRISAELRRIAQRVRQIELHMPESDIADEILEQADRIDMIEAPTVVRRDA